jgi:hypothetical protein
MVCDVAVVSSFSSTVAIGGGAIARSTVPGVASDVGVILRGTAVTSSSAMAVVVVTTTTHGTAVASSSTAVAIVDVVVGAMLHGTAVASSSSTTAVAVVVVVAIITCGTVASSSSAVATTVVAAVIALFGTALVALKKAFPSAFAVLVRASGIVEEARFSQSIVEDRMNSQNIEPRWPQ